jgi:hypothetical protein
MKGVKATARARVSRRVSKEERESKLLMAQNEDICR